MLSTGLNRQYRCDTKIWSVAQNHYVVFIEIIESTKKFNAYLLHKFFSNNKKMTPSPLEVI